MSSLSTEEVNALIANSRRLIDEAKAALTKSRVFFAEHNIDPREAMEFVRRHGGEPAVQAVAMKVKQEIQKIDEELERQRVHAPKVRATGKRARIRSNMI
jgi:hypothetical protein